MYHTIEFVATFTIDLATSAKQRLERLCIQKGVRKRAQIKPYVIQTKQGPVEVADLFFDDGTVVRTVPFGFFSFVD